MHTKETLISDLSQIGIKKGDTLFLRISYKSIGKVIGGPKTFLDAIIDVIGENGNILITAFPKRFPTILKFLQIFTHYNINNKPTPITGIVAKTALNYKDSYYSKNPAYPFVIIGKDAKYLANKFDYTYGSYDVLKEISEKFYGKCLRIGGKEFTGTTHIAFSEALIKSKNFQKKISLGIYYQDGKRKKWYKTTSSTFCYHGMKKMYNYVEESNKIFESGKIGNGDSTLSSMYNTLEYEREFIGSDPTRLFCSNSKCSTCRLSYSCSNNSNLFYKQLIKDLLRLRSFTNLYKLIIIKFFSVKHI